MAAPKGSKQKRETRDIKAESVRITPRFHKHGHRI